MMSMKVKQRRWRREGDRRFDARPDLLGQFAYQAGFDRFVRFPLAPGKLPASLEVGAGRSDAHEDTVRRGFRLQPFDALERAFRETELARRLGFGPETLERLPRLWGTNEGAETGGRAEGQVRRVRAGRHRRDIAG